MIRTAATFLACLFTGGAAIADASSPLRDFVRDREFCAYMASPPEDDREAFLARYQAALHAVMAFIRKSQPRATDTQAIFLVKAACDEALRSGIHDR